MSEATDNQTGAEEAVRAGSRRKKVATGAAATGAVGVAIASLVLGGWHGRAPIDPSDPPLLTAAAVNTAGTTLTLTYDETLDGASDPAGSAYVVKYNGTNQPSPTAVDASGTTVALTLAGTAYNTDTVLLNYTVPGANPVQALDNGDDAAALTNQAVTNNSTQNPPGGSVANIWVDSDGGTCLDSATAVSYSDAAACGPSLDVANDTCENGDVVRIASLASITHTLSGSNSRTSDCLFRPATDGTPVSLNGAMIFQSTTDRISMTSVHQTIDTDDYLNTLQITGDHLTFSDHTATRFDFDSGSNNGLITDSDFGPCIASYGPGGPGTISNNQGVCNNRILDTATDIRVQYSNLHGNLQTWNGSAGPNGGPPHSECLAIFGGIRVQVWQNKMWDCGDSASILIQANPGTGQKPTDLSFVGNWINTDWNDADGTATNVKCNGMDIRYNVEVTGSADLAGTFEYSFNVLNRCSSTSGLGLPWLSANVADQIAGSLPCTNSNSCDRYAPNVTSVRMVGNIGSTTGGNQDGPCPSDGGNNTIKYNVQWKWGGSGSGYALCGSNATEADYSAAFLTNTTLHGSFNFHLTGTVQAWENSIPTSVTGGCPLDIDKVQQPVTGTLCDPGSDGR